MFTFMPSFIPRAIVLIGCGGTGGHLAPRLAQLSRSLSKRGSPQSFIPEPIPLIFIDGDVVEEKNLLRQNFVPRDVGQNKSTVLTNRYSNAFDVPIFSIPKMMDDHTHLSTFAEESGINFTFGYSHTVFILAVDSAKARREILQNILQFSKVKPLSSDRLSFGRCVILDAGNEDSFGQVSLYTNTWVAEYPSAAKKLSASFPQNIPQPTQVSDIPLPLYEYVERGNSAQERSCAELPQTLAINSMMAACILAYLQNLILLKPMPMDTMRFSLSSGGSAEFNTPRRWLDRAYKGYVREGSGNGRQFRRVLDSPHSSGEPLIELNQEQENFNRFLTQFSPTETFNFSYIQMLREGYADSLGWETGIGPQLGIFQAYRAHLSKLFRKSEILLGPDGSLSPVKKPPAPSVVAVPAIPPPMVPIVNAEEAEKVLKTPRRRAPRVATVEEVTIAQTPLPRLDASDFFDETP